MDEYLEHIGVVASSLSGSPAGRRRNGPVSAEITTKDTLRVFQSWEAPFQLLMQEQRQIRRLAAPAKRKRRRCAQPAEGGRMWHAF
jgi:hypothetical protein